MENCFEKHRVNLDPSSSASQTSTVYRPIDKYMNVLPHLIGSEKWKQHWHVGLINDPNVQQHEPKQRSEDAGMSHEQASSIASSLERTSLMASQDSLAKSVSSVDERPTSQPVTFADDDDNISFSSAVVPNTSNFFRDQIEHRKIVNLFDDEPPSLSQSPVLRRGPVNLFDDNISDDSVAVTSENVVKPKEQKSAFQQPVDLFNDNEFDNFIKKIEEQPEKRKTENATNKEVKKPTVSKPLQGNIQYDERNVVEEVKKVVSKKPDPPAPTPIPKIQEKTKAEKPEPKLRATNLFDDDDQDDYFNEIIKQKSANKVSQPVAQTLGQSSTVPAKSKFTSLFDDEEDDEESFDDIFKKKAIEKQVAPVKSKSAVPVKVKSSLFDDDDDEVLPSSTKQDVEKNVPREVIKDTAKVIPTAATKIIPTPRVETKPEVKPEIIPEIVPEIAEVEEIPEKPSSKSSLEIFDEPESFSTKQELQPGDESVEKVVEEAGSTMEDITVTLPEDTPPGVEKTFGEPIDSEWIEEPLPQTPDRSHSATLPFLSDEPPEDDDNDWTTEDNFDDSELFFSPSSNDYSSVPLFDDVPPEDDDFVEPPPLETPSLPAPVSSNLTETVEKEKEVPQKEIPAIDEIDRSVSTGVIKSKMDIFNRKLEETSSLPSVKKSLPGKLNSNLKINVGALMPGARPTKEVIESNDDRENDVTAKVSSIAVQNSQQSENTSLLNNDFTKSRARIQTKRRPSTRRGRKSIYENSTLVEETGEIEPEKPVEKTDDSVSEAATTASTSVFDTPKSMPNIEQAIVPAKDEKKTVTTNKISVFYDDEDDTRILVEQERQKEKDEKKSQRVTAALFDDDDNDDDFFASSLPPKKIQTAQTKKESKDVLSVHYDESDEDLFAPKKIKNPPKEIASTSSSKTKGPDPKGKTSSSLFDDDDDDDLFASIAKKKISTAKNTSHVSKSSVTSSLKTVSKVVQSKSSSLFGDDDDDDDDDLFNSKSKGKKSMFLLE